MQIEANQRRSRVCRYVKALDIEGMDGEDVAMRLLTLRRTWPSIARLPKIGNTLGSTLRQQRLRGISSASREARTTGRNIVDHPMPPPAPCRCVRIIHGDGITLCSRWRVGPAQLRRFIGTGTAEAIQDLLVAQGAIGAEGRAVQREPRCSLASTTSAHQYGKIEEDAVFDTVHRK